MTLTAPASIEVTDHALRRWYERVDQPAVAPRVAWLHGVRVTGSALDGDEIRYHEATHTLLVRKNSCIVTVIDADGVRTSTREALADLRGETA